jgi:hypothetical protein
MPAIRVPIRRLMIWVSVAAINLAAFRALFATRNNVLLAVLMLAFLMFQLGIFRALRNRRGSRPYWLGFIGGGSIALLSIISTDYVPEGIGGTIWNPYFQAVGILIEESEPWFTWMFGTEPNLDELILSFCAFLPLLIAGFAGGRLGRLLFRPRSMPMPAT